jgi:hypothetical protein
MWAEEPAATIRRKLRAATVAGVAPQIPMDSGTVSTAGAALAEKAWLYRSILHALHISPDPLLGRFFQNAGAGLTKNARALGLCKRDYFSWHSISSS